MGRIGRAEMTGETAKKTPLSLYFIFSGFTRWTSELSRYKTSVLDWNDHPVKEKSQYEGFHFSSLPKRDTVYLGWGGGRLMLSGLNVNTWHLFHQKMPCWLQRIHMAYKLNFLFLNKHSLCRKLFQKFFTFSWCFITLYRFFS